MEKLTRVSAEFAGDELLRTCQTTGYNIYPAGEDFSKAIAGANIHYSHTIGALKHFDGLLSTMETEGIIETSQVQFGVRSSTILYTGWPFLYPESVSRRKILRQNPNGQVLATEVASFMEITVTFTPRDNQQAGEIANFLNTHTKREAPNAIIDSPIIPDIRLGIAASETLTKLGFVQVFANIYETPQASLVVLQQNTAFRPPWKLSPVLVNKEMLSYITMSLKGTSHR